MNRNRLLITTLACIMCSTFCAQTVKTDSIGLMGNDSINKLPQLSKEFYADINSMNRTYDYELQNMKQRLKMRATEVEALGIITTIAVYSLTIGVGTADEWPTWIVVSSAVVEIFATTVPFFIWAKRLRQKADAIDVSTAYVLPMNDHISVGVSHFRNNNEQAYNGFGIGVKATF